MRVQHGELINASSQDWQPILPQSAANDAAPFRAVGGWSDSWNGFGLAQIPMESKILRESGVESKIYLIRGEKVMLDFDLAELYGVPTKQLNQQVRRNAFRFPSDFMFPLNFQELINLKSHIVTSSLAWGGRRKPPLAFTEQGIAMLSSVLGSRRAVEVNIAIMRTFVQIRSVLVSNRELEKRINELEANYDGKCPERSNHAPRKSIAFHA